VERGELPIPRVYTWYGKNAFVGTTLLGLYVILKAFVLAKGDITTAVGILQYAGIVTVVLAGALSALPILVALALAFTTYRWLGADTPRNQAWPLVAMIGAGLFFAAVMTPWTYLSAAVALGLLFAALRRLDDADRSRWIRWPIRVLVTVIAVVATVACSTQSGSLTSR